jgi:superfamily II DNA or RNA helicase
MNTFYSIPWAGSLVLCFLTAWVPLCRAHQEGIDLSRCRQTLSMLSGSPVPAGQRLDYSKLNDEQRAFLDKVWLPTLGIRSLQKSDSELRSCSLLTKNCVQFGGFGEGYDIEIRWERAAALAEPKIQWEANGHKVLVIPKGYQWDSAPGKGAYIVRSFLEGHPLHPYGHDENAVKERSALNEPKILLKRVQVDAIAAFHEAIDNGDKAFLFVGPTGVGKTEVMLSGLEKKIVDTAKALKHFPTGSALSSVPPPPKVHFVVLPDTYLKGQVLTDVTDLKKRVGFDLLHWGDGASYLTIDALEQRAKTSNQPIVVVTTIDSLILSVHKNVEPTGDFNFDKAQMDATEAAFRKMTSMLLVDEAHHAGQPEMRSRLPDLVDREKGGMGMVAGGTATPDHSQVKIIEKLFDRRAFWAYLDTRESYRERRTELERSVAEVVEQLAAAVSQGELNSFSPVPLNPDRFREHSGLDLFTESRLIPGDEGDSAAEAPSMGNRYVIDPRHYGNVIQRLFPHFLKHEAGFLTAATKVEAEKFGKDLQAELDQYVLSLKPGDPLPVFLQALNEEQRAEFIRDVQATQDPNEPRKRRYATVAVLHSGLTPKQKEELKADMKAGKIAFLVTVRMLDEGINIQRLSLWVDLNRTTNAKSQLQRLGRILRLVTGKGWKRTHGRDGVEWLSFQEPNDVEIAQMLLDMYAISRGQSISRSRQLPEKEGSSAPLEVEVDADGRPLIQWTESDLKKARDHYFFSEKDKGEKAAAQDAKKVIEHVERGLPLDPFGSDDRSLRSVYDKLTGRLDMSRTKSGRKRFDAIIDTHPEVREAVRKVQEQRLDRRKAFETAKGTAEALSLFVEKYGRVPEKTSKPIGGKEVERSLDEKAFVDAIELYLDRNDLDFLLPVSAALSPTRLKMLKVSEHIDRLLSRRESVLQLADDFVTMHEGQLPDADAKGLEGLLAKAVERIAEGGDLGSRPVAIALAARAEANALRKEAELASKRATEGARTSAKSESAKPGSPYRPLVEAPLVDRLVQSIPARIGALSSRDTTGRMNLETLQRQLKKYQELSRETAELGNTDDDHQLRSLYGTELKELEEKIFSISGLRQILDGTQAEDPRKVAMTVESHKGAVTEMVEFYRKTIAELNRGLKAKAGGALAANELWSFETNELKSGGKHRRRMSITIQSPKSDPLRARDLFSREPRTAHTASFLETGSVQTHEVTVLFDEQVPASKPIQSRRYFFEKGAAFVDKRLASATERGGENALPKQIGPNDFVRAVQIGMLEELRAQLSGP